MVDLKRDIARAVHDGGGFVDVSADGGERLSILFTSTTPVTISVRTMHVNSDIKDARWDFFTRPGDVDPFGGGYIDLI